LEKEANMIGICAVLASIPGSSRQSGSLLSVYYWWMF
jgi:undecaprenyl pyrophosphate phosphatase UppP